MEFWIQMVKSLPAPRDVNEHKWRPQKNISWGRAIRPDQLVFQNGRGMYSKILKIHA